MKRAIQLAVITCLAGSAGAQEIKPYQAQEIKPYRAQEIKPYQAQEVKPSRPASEPPGRSERQGAAGMAELMGAWQSSVSGAVWTSPSSVPGFDTLHISPGALAGLLVIYPNGTYIWNSYGGKKGRWTRSDKSDYPLVLEDTVENKRWYVGLDQRTQRLYIWDGNAISYTARRPAQQ
ncbi:hypothetical protein [Massilia horti]|uniref:Uncharacterized protein n=1 Tax=Massilia horti TaxID=2562153 RepID=A0A4Y9T972_9BURK|nr:hypothetical protein [Massilia horti]TFW35986.1 hypothetical protein E4O92_00730 [Massilia horti]